MADEPPKIVAINHDDYHARYVGTTAAGHQFFLTTPFVAGFIGEGRREFIALYLFDAQGQLLEADIEEINLETRTGQIALPGNTDTDSSFALLEAKIASLGNIHYGRIEIQPFEIERFGISFGLIPVPPEEEDEEYCWVSVEPGDYMAFPEPWDSGEYDT